MVVVVLAVVDGSMCVYYQDDVCAAVAEQSSGELQATAQTRPSRALSSLGNFPKASITGHPIKTYLQYLYLRM